MGNAKSCHGIMTGHNDDGPSCLIIREMPHNVRQLHIAVKSNDRRTVENLVAQGVNINFPFLNPSSGGIKDGNTPLIIAVSLNYTEVVEVLLRAGAYINKCDRNGCTPIYKAAFHGRPSLIERLTKAGADVNLADYHGKTPLYICVNNAIVHSCRLAILKLLAAGAIVDKCDGTGEAPIHVAARWKLVDILLLLLSARSDADLCDWEGRTPLYVCVRSLTTKLYAEDLRHTLPCVMELFQSGADMLNLVEWLLKKGPGIPENMLERWPDDFASWYRSQINTPPSLANACRKHIQMCLAKTDLCKSIGLSATVKKLPLPAKVQTFLCRKMFFRNGGSSNNNNLYNSSIYGNNATNRMNNINVNNPYAGNNTNSYGVQTNNYGNTYTNGISFGGLWGNAASNFRINGAPLERVAER